LNPDSEVGLQINGASDFQRKGAGGEADRRLLESAKPDCLE
jgi:hypothetical protein